MPGPDVFPQSSDEADPARDALAALNRVMRERACREIDRLLEAECSRS
jgi:hypothetical protein